MKQRNIRKKRTLEEEDDEEQQQQQAEGEGQQEGEIAKSALEDLKLLHKMRKRTAGIHSSALAASRADDADREDEGNELMESYVKAQGGAQVLTEEQHMERFVEQEVAKRLGKQVDDLARATSQAERDELALYEVPEALKAHVRQEVSIPGLNTAITEVEVSKEAKLRKIEETEAVKRRLLEKDAGWAAEPGPEDAKQARIHRANFVPRFGRPVQKAPVEDLDPEELERRRRFISERTPDPRKLKQQQLKQQRR